MEPILGFISNTYDDYKPGINESKITQGFRRLPENNCEILRNSDLSFVYSSLISTALI